MISVPSVGSGMSKLLKGSSKYDSTHHQRQDAIQDSDKSEVFKGFKKHSLWWVGTVTHLYRLVNTANR